MKKRMHFRVSHRDKAERAIIRAGRSVGATVRQLNGKDLPDLCVGYRGVTYLPEVKSRILTEDKGRKPRMRTTRMSEGQKAFAEAWRGGPTGIIYEPADLLRMIGATFDFDTKRWLAENGAFLCEQCWLPENGLHAKDCPTRKALKVPAKVKSAYRAAKEAQDVLPKERRQCGMGGCPLKAVPNGYFCSGHDDPEFRPSRGVEGELQPLQPLRKCQCRHAPSSHGRILDGDTEKGACWVSGCACSTYSERHREPFGAANLPNAQGSA